MVDVLNNISCCQLGVYIESLEGAKIYVVMLPMGDYLGFGICIAGNDIICVYLLYMRLTFQ